MKYIQDQLKRQDNLSANQMEDAIWLLWQRNQELTKCLRQWEMLLEDLGVDYNSITEGLQVHTLNTLNFCRKKKENFNAVFNFCQKRMIILMKYLKISIPVLLYFYCRIYFLEIDHFCQ